MLTLSDALTATLFHNGKFDAHAVNETAKAVAAYGVGLTGLILVKILAPGFYAQQDIRTPVKIALIVLVITQIMNVLVCAISYSKLVWLCPWVWGRVLMQGCFIRGLRQASALHAF